MSLKPNTFEPGAHEHQEPISFKKILSGWVQSARNFARVSHDYDRMIELPDHILRDIGVSRCQIEAERQRHRTSLFRWVLR
ncbi:MAG: DUF1127 domain-containing protein [Pseudomonadota bacterium]